VDEVIRNAAAFNRAMRAQGIASCGKHFPGYSAATLDAHHELPRIDRTLEQLNHEELAVFRAFVGRGGSPNRPSARVAISAASGGRAIGVNRPYLESDAVDSMMICHGWYPSLEPKKKAASLSHRVVTGLLREEMGFEGLVMTDDLDMGAILNEYGLEETIRLAITAGNDLAMICHRLAAVEEAHKVLQTLPAAQTDRALASVAEFKRHMQPPHDFSEKAFRAIDQEIWDLRVAVLGAERAAQRSPEDGKRSPVEVY
jgi:beta-N-acetylhexosaminidase